MSSNRDRKAFFTFFVFFSFFTIPASADQSCGGAPCVRIDMCHVAVCDPTTATCGQVSIDECIAPDLCSFSRCDPTTGACVHGAVPCPTPDSCTTGTCDLTTGDCVYSPRVCPKGDACETVTCDPALGCVASPKTCTASDACHAPSCDPSVPDGCVQTPISCDDGDPCTVDSCDPANDSGCVNVAVPGCRSCLSASDCVYENSSACDAVDCNIPTVCSGSPCRGTCSIAPLSCPSFCDPERGCIECLHESDCPASGSFCKGRPVCTAEGLCSTAGNPCPDPSSCSDVNATCGECSDSSPCPKASPCDPEQRCVAGRCETGSAPCRCGRICLPIPGIDGLQHECVDCLRDEDCSSPPPNVPGCESAESDGFDVTWEHRRASLVNVSLPKGCRMEFRCYRGAHACVASTKCS